MSFRDRMPPTRTWRSDQPTKPYPSFGSRCSPNKQKLEEQYSAVSSKFSVGYEVHLQCSCRITSHLLPRLWIWCHREEGQWKRYKSRSAVIVSQTGCTVQCSSMPQYGLYITVRSESHSRPGHETWSTLCSRPRKRVSVAEIFHQNVA